MLGLMSEDKNVDEVAGGKKEGDGVKLVTVVYIQNKRR